MQTPVAVEVVHPQGKKHHSKEELIERGANKRKKQRRDSRNPSGNRFKTNNAGRRREEIEVVKPQHLE